jgi:hypothetical protein
MKDKIPIVIVEVYRGVANLTRKDAGVRVVIVDWGGKDDFDAEGNPAEVCPEDYSPSEVIESGPEDYSLDILDK